MDEHREYEIRKRAYELWEKDGEPAGKHLKYWLLAEKELAEARAHETDSDLSTSTEKQPS